MTARARLPNRRGTLFLAFHHEGMAYIGSASFYPDGRIAEVFLDAEKTSSTADTVARDAAIAASLAFQHGCPAADLRAALTQHEDGTGASALAHFLDLVAQDEVSA